MRMKKLLSAAALLLGASTALAGLEQPAPVSVTLNGDGSGSANGAQLTARVSKNVVEYIGCGVRTFEDGVGGVILFGFCQASNATEVSGSCSTDNPALVSTIGDQDDYSFITFSWDADGICRSIGNSTQSFYLPIK